jgi:hypothetical protein
MWELFPSNRAKDMGFVSLHRFIRSEFTFFSQNYRWEAAFKRGPQMPLDEFAGLKHLVSREFDV